MSSIRGMRRYYLVYQLYKIFIEKFNSMYIFCIFVHLNYKEKINNNINNIYCKTEWQH